MKTPEDVCTPEILLERLRHFFKDEVEFSFEIQAPSGALWLNLGEGDDVLQLSVDSPADNAITVISNFHKPIDEDKIPDVLALIAAINRDRRFDVFILEPETRLVLGNYLLLLQVLPSKLMLQRFFSPILHISNALRPLLDGLNSGRNTLEEALEGWAGMEVQLATYDERPVFKETRR